MLKKLFILTALSVACPAQAAEKQVVLQIDQMTCQLCAYLVNKELREVDGVLTTKADIKQKSVKVTALDRVPNSALINVVEKLRYHAFVVE